MRKWVRVVRYIQSRRVQGKDRQYSGAAARHREDASDGAGVSLESRGE